MSQSKYPSAISVLWIGMVSNFDAHPDSGFHFDGDLDPDPDPVPTFAPVEKFLHSSASLLYIVSSFS
jgi:hypothetical protein